MHSIFSSICPPLAATQIRGDWWTVTYTRISTSNWVKIVKRTLKFVTDYVKQFQSVVFEQFSLWYERTTRLKASVPQSGGISTEWSQSFAQLFVRVIETFVWTRHTTNSPHRLVPSSSSFYLKEKKQCNKCFFTR